MGTIRGYSDSGAADAVGPEALAEWIEIQETAIELQGSSIMQLLGQ